MSHLMSAETKGLFATTVVERPKSAIKEGGVLSGPMPMEKPAPFAVAVAMTRDQMLQDNMSYPRRDTGDVRNLEPRKRGCHY